MAHNFTLISSFGVDRNIYSEIGTIVPKERHDTILTGRIGLEYQAKDWIKAGINYEYKEDISNIDLQDYNRNQVTLSCTLMI